MNIEGLWPMYAWAAAVALAIVAEHVAGAALLGLFGWEMLVHLPESVRGYWLLTAALLLLSPLVRAPRTDALDQEVAGAAG